MIITNMNLGVQKMMTKFQTTEKIRETKLKRKRRVFLSLITFKKVTTPLKNMNIQGEI